MGLPIAINDNLNPSFFEVNTVPSVNWKFSPPQLHFYYIMGSTSPPAFDLIIEYPDLTVSPGYELFTNWRFEGYFSGPSNFLRFIGVNPQQYYLIIGTLGTPYTDGGDFYRKTLNIGFNALPTLSAGNYQVFLACTVTAINPTTGLREIVSQRYIPIELDVIFYTTGMLLPFEVAYQGRISLSPGVWSPMVFDHYVGTPLPPTQDLYYFRCGNGSDAPIVDTNSFPIDMTFVPIHEYMSKSTVAMSDGAISILVLPVGVYQYFMDISFPGTVTKRVYITLNVMDIPSGDFSITPGNIDLIGVIGGNPPVPQSISVFAGDPWSIIGSIPSWLQLSQYSGSAYASIIVSPVFATMASGDYSYTLIFDNGTDQIPVVVNLHVYAFLVNPFTPQSLQFTKELKYLNFFSIVPGTYIDFTIAITTYELNTNIPIVYNRSYKFPLYNGTGKFHVGTIVHTLFDEIQHLEDMVPDLVSNYFKNQYRPAEVLVSYQEVEFVVGVAGPSPDLVAGSLASFRMIKGQKPYVTNLETCLLTVAQQEVMRITPNSVIGVSFAHLGNPVVVVKKNNIQIDGFTITSFSPKDIIYSYYRFINDVKAGDSIDIIISTGPGAFDTRSQRYVVFNPGLESTFFFFENGNGVMEPYEFSGRRRVQSKITHQTSQKFKDLFAIESKVYAKEVESIVINTGQLTKVDHKVITAIIKSLTVWVALDDPKGPYLRVDSTSTKITKQDTSNNEEDFDIEFNILENTEC